MLLGEPADSRAETNPDKSEDQEAADRKDMLRKRKGWVFLRNVGAAQITNVQSRDNVNNKLKITEFKYKPSK